MKNFLFPLSCTFVFYGSQRMKETEFCEKEKKIYIIKEEEEVRVF